MESSYFCDLGAHAKIRTPTITPSRLFPLLSAHPRLICGGRGVPDFFWNENLLALYSMIQHEQTSTIILICEILLQAERVKI